HRTISSGCVRACHDLSEGGLGVAAAEMAFGGGFGLALRLADVPRAADLKDDGRVLFSESNSRFLVEVAHDRTAEFEKAFAGLPCARIGEVTDTGRLIVTGLSGKRVVEADVEALRAAWKRPLAW
ncbi:MAG TPA: AIR synthase-related protein, partial [Phycisphaerae bacterium]|nr:AIR synthase-related protein [Phycisphaerae bacterium]